MLDPAAAALDPEALTVAIHAPFGRSAKHAVLEGRMDPRDIAPTLTHETDGPVRE